MKSIRSKEVKPFVDMSIVAFHQSRFKCLETVKLNRLLRRKSPYLMRARNIAVVSELVRSILDDFLFSVEVKLFRQFQENLALFVLRKACGRGKLAAEGVDYAFSYQGIRHLISIRPRVRHDNSRTRPLRGFRKLPGQNLRYFISGNQNLYTDIIEPLGHKAKEHNEAFLEQKGRVINLFSQEFMADYCDDGRINWTKLVEFNSGNIPKSSERS